jgi:hypothetical protein
MTQITRKSLKSFSSPLWGTVDAGEFFTFDDGYERDLIAWGYIAAPTFSVPAASVEPVPEPVPEPGPSVEDTIAELERAREPNGTYKGDDPSTPDVNEAYVTAPTKRGRGRPRSTQEG